MCLHPLPGVLPRSGKCVRRRLTISSAVCLSLTATRAQARNPAATYVWGGGSQYWSGPANRGTVDVPNSAGVAADIDGGKTSLQSLVSVNGSFTVGELTIDAGDGIFITEGSRLTLAGSNSFTGAGTLANSGSVTFEGLTYQGFLILSGSVTLTGAGTITLIPGSQIQGDNVTLTNVDNTIKGFTPNGGGLGGNQIAIVNGAAGIINANVSGQTLTFDPGNGGLTNAGLMEATGGGILFLSGNYNQTFTNQGEFRVNDGSTVNASPGIVTNLANGTLTGGTYTVLSTTTAATTLSFGGGNITTNAATIVLSGANSVFADLGALSDNRGSLSLLASRQFTTAGALSNEGTLKLDAGSTLHVGGGFTDGPASTLAFTTGGIQSQGAQSAGVLQVNGTATLNGALTVSLGAGAQIPTSSTITILAATGGVSGRFTNVPNGERLSTADGTGSFQVNFGPDSAFSTKGVVLSGFVASGVVTHPSFFTGEVALSNGVYYLAFSTGSPFGYYSYLSDPHYLYHFDLGYEYVFDAADGNDGVYLYDFKSQDFYYTAPRFPFPYLYDFNLQTVLYYYPDPKMPGTTTRTACVTSTTSPPARSSASKIGAANCPVPGRYPRRTRRCPVQNPEESLVLTSS